MAANDVAEKALRRTWHCPSYENIDTILLYGSMTRQAFKLVESQRVWGSLGEEGVSTFHAQPYATSLGSLAMPTVIVRSTSTRRRPRPDIGGPSISKAYTPQAGNSRVAMYEADWLPCFRACTNKATSSAIGNPLVAIKSDRAVGILRLLGQRIEKKGNNCRGSISYRHVDVASVVADRTKIADMAQ